MISHHFSDVEQSTIYVVDGKLSDIENFDEIALEHWEYFGNKKPMFNKEYLAGLRVVIAKDMCFIFFTKVLITMKLGVKLICSF
jgi:hypothetical protein